MASTNWFDAGGQRYAAFRPQYPAALATALAQLPTARRVAVDVGCGNGQLTTRLAAAFGAVIGTDPSADQLAHAVPHKRVHYVRAAAEALPVASGSVDLVTAAQSAHWFDLPAFYAECRRVAAPGAVLALITYGTLRLGGDAEVRLQRFSGVELGAYWPPERALVDGGYRGLDFPFPELTIGPITITATWTLAELLGYVSTWSAVRRLREAGQAEVLERFADDLAELWGEAGPRREVTWPIAVRIGSLTC